MAFKTVLCTSESKCRERQPDLYLIYKKLSLSVVGIWGNALLCQTVLKSLYSGFPGQYDMARVWGRLDDDGRLTVCFDETLHIPEFYLRGFEQALRDRLEAHRL